MEQLAWAVGGAVVPWTLYRLALWWTDRRQWALRWACECRCGQTFFGPYRWVGNLRRRRHQRREGHAREYFLTSSSES